MEDLLIIDHIFNEIKPLFCNKTNLRKLRGSIWIKKFSASFSALLFHFSLIFIFSAIIIFFRPLSKICLLVTGSKIMSLAVALVFASSVSILFFPIVYTRFKGFISKWLDKFHTKSEKDYFSDVDNFIISAIVPIHPQDRPPNFCPLSSLAELLKQKLVPENFSLFLFDFKQNKFLPKITFNLDRSLLDKTDFTLNSAFILKLSKLSSIRDILTTKDLLVPKEKEELSLIKSGACLPILYRAALKAEALLGFISFGRFLKGNYNPESLEVLSKLTGYLTIGLLEVYLRVLRDEEKMEKIRAFIAEATSKEKEALNSYMLIEEAKSIADGKDQEIYKNVLANPILNAWSRFDYEVHRFGLMQETRDLMKQYFDLDFPLGFRVRPTHGERVELLIKSLDRLGLYNELINPQQNKVEKFSWLKSQTEWFDGTGYPDGLKAEQIPQYSRMVALAEGFEIFYDCFRDIGQTLKAIDKLSGSKFDPDLVLWLKKVIKRKSLSKLYGEECRRV